MMKGRGIVLTMVSFFIAVTFGFSGCKLTESSSAPAASEKKAVCFVIGGHANSQGLNFNSPLVQETVTYIVRHDGFISVVNADGKPQVIYAKSYELDERFKDASFEKLDLDAKTKAASLLTSMQRVVADDPEVDYLEALRLAVRSLSDIGDGYDNKQIIVLGTGISTTGVMDFGNNLLSAEPDVLVDLLEERSEIPDFTGFLVAWQQLGDSAAPQKDLTAELKERLKDVYSGLIERGGGTFVYNEMIPNPIDSDTLYPAVTPVEFPESAPIQFDEGVLEESDKNVFEQPVILTEKQVTFIGDKAEYLHPEEAQETLRPIAEYLISHPDIRLLLVGTTAGDTDSEFTMNLSKDRAEAVRQSLSDLGVDADRIVAVGLGSTQDPWHIWGVGTESSAASSNRKVVLMDAASERAASILRS